MILSYCTKSRTFSRDVYGDCFSPPSRKVKFLPYKLWKFLLFFEQQRILGMLRRLSNGKPEKNDINILNYQSFCAYVLPTGFMLQQPHAGQIVISKFQTTFNSSAIESPVNLWRNFWCPCSLKMSFRFFAFERLFKKP